MSKRETFLNPITRECKAYGENFDITPQDQQFFAGRNLEFPKLCPDCREKKKHIAVMTCADCGKPFELTELEGEFYERKGLSIPRRCPDCRRKRKAEREAAGK